MLISSCDGDHKTVFYQQTSIGQAIYTNMKKIIMTVFVDFFGWGLS